MLGRVALTFGGLFFGFILVEIIFRIIPPEQLNLMYELNAQGRRVFITDERMGWTHIPNVRTQWATADQVELEVETNSLGLRDNEHTYEKPPGVYRILMLGDSFVESLQIPLEDIFPTTLESCLSGRLGRPVEIINAGHSVYGLGEDYLFYLHEGVKYKPDLVLLGIFIQNDISWDLDRHDRNILIVIDGSYRFDLNEQGELQKRWLSWENPEHEVSLLELFFRRYSMTYRVIRYPDSKIWREYRQFVKSIFTEEVPTLPDWGDFIYARDFANNPKTPDYLINRWNLFKVLFAELKQNVENNGAQLAVFLIPSKYQAHQRFRDPFILEMANIFENLDTVAWDFEHEPNRTVVAYLNEMNVPMLDLLPAFQAHDAVGGYSLYNNKDIHFNREGHYMTRDLLCDWLIESEQINLPGP